MPIKDFPSKYLSLALTSAKFIINQNFLFEFQSKSYCRKTDGAQSIDSNGFRDSRLSIISFTKAFTAISVLKVYIVAIIAW